MSKPPSRIAPLEPAVVEWQGTVPVSQRYNDVYFSPHDGLAESRHVFLRHNELPQRWSASGAAHFVIAETGFGSGLNFLAASHAWLASMDKRARLHYVAVEKHPMQAGDLARVLAVWPELSALRADLLNHYPPLVRGAHRLHLFGGRVLLTLYFMDVAEWLDELEIKADAWLLDGFAPAKNPRMWSARTLQRIGALTAPGGTFSTFTAAGEVRRGLQAAGFTVSKAEGYAGKREMLHGSLPKAAASPVAAPWFRYRAVGDPQRNAVIVGAGLAGAFTARALAQRGWRVSVLEQQARPGQGASGNAAAVIYGKFSTHDAPEYQFYQQAYLYALSRYPDLGLTADTWTACGVLQLACDEAGQKRQAALAELWPPGVMQLLNAAAAAEVSGVPLRCGGLYFPQAGWVAPARLCEQLLQCPGVELTTDCSVAAMEHTSAAGWRLLDPAGRMLAAAPVVILANADGARLLPQTDYLPLNRVRGQVSHVPATEASTALRTVLSFDGYITPAIQGVHNLGATFDRDNPDTRLATADHLHNLRNLENAAPALHRALAVTDAAALPGRVAFRTYAGELPVVGPAPDAAFFRREYAALAKGQLRKSYPDAAYHPGLLLNLAHGARGVTTTLLAAEMIAAYLESEPQPVPESLRQALHPGRFLIRQLKKNRTNHRDTENTEGV
jgi:tRNA 5-methylaminomethyl-2-thiouridine biosynthesis bifunctional protein